MEHLRFTIPQLFDALGEDEITKMEITEARPRIRFSQHMETGKLIIANCDANLKEKIEGVWKTWCDS
jgi:hypothetical protein